MAKIIDTLALSGFWAGVKTRLNNKADASHSHVIADVTSLQTLLDGKANSAHTHTIANVTGLQASLDGKSDTGHTHSLATTSVNGLMSSTDKSKLDGTAGIDDNVTSADKVWSSYKTQQKLNAVENLILPKIIISDTEPAPEQGLVWFRVTDIVEDISPINDYLFRYDASMLDLANNANVTNWQDLSSNGYDLTPSIGNSVFLEAGLNGKPCVKFDKTSLVHTPFTLANTNEATLFLVCELDSTSLSQSIFGVGYDTNYDGLALRYSSSGRMTVRVAGTQAASVTIDSKSAVYTGVYYSDDIAHLYRNGALGNIGAAPPMTAVNRIFLNGVDGEFQGRVSEAIYFDRALTANELTIMNTYLMQKWGI